jgi:hypothetical protein
VGGHREKDSLINDILNNIFIADTKRSFLNNLKLGLRESGKTVSDLGGIIVI